MASMLVIGPTFCDLLLNGFTGLPEKGEEKYLEGYTLSLGGMAITAAAAAQLEMPTALLTVLGKDALGTRLAEELTARGADLRPSLPRTGKNTNLTMVFLADNDRSFLTCEMDSGEFRKEIEQRLALLNPGDYSHIHVSFSLLDSPAVQRFLKESRMAGGLVCSDLGFRDTLGWDGASASRLKNLDYFLPNLEEALAITGGRNVREALEILKQTLSCPIITMGADGACALNREGEFIQVRPPRITVRNTTGAGDAFTAGFLFGLSAGLSLEDALRRGVAAGSINAASEDSISRDITRKTLEAVIYQGKEDPRVS